MPEPIQLLLVEDEEPLVQAFQRLAERHDYRLAVARTGLEAVEILSKQRTDVALLDLNLAGFSGLQILEYIRSNRIDTETIVISGTASLSTAVSALKMGAYDTLTKPIEDMERVALLIEKAHEKGTLRRRLRNLESRGPDEGPFEGLLGRSPQMREVYGLIENVASSSSTVLLLGESGTGKELVARAIHAKSPRQSHPFVVINCSALPETLLESELFGHMKGAFTGATGDRKGLFREADGGTIFLDEIGEIPPSMQVKLLRVLQDRQVRPLGGSESHGFDVRVISATNKDLHAAVKRKEFREDLFYRLNVITISLPPLRDRREDIPLLAYHFLKKFTEKMAKKTSHISMDALSSLQEYHWPGNVRELENVMERAVVMSEEEILTARELPPKLLGNVFYVPEMQSETELSKLQYQEAKEKALNLFNRTYINRLLKETGGNISRASEMAGMDRSNFKKILKKCDVNLKEYRSHAKDSRRFVS